MNDNAFGYSVDLKDNIQLSHLLFMDAGNKHYVHKLINTVTKYNSDIQMEFGLDKYATVSINKGKT